MGPRYPVPTKIAEHGSALRIGFASAIFVGARRGDDSGVVRLEAALHAVCNSLSFASARISAGRLARRPV